MWASASAAQFASLSTYTGTPNRRPSSSRSGRPVSGMFTLVSTVPVANSICEGTPTPIASGRPASAITSRTTCSTPSSSASALTVTVGCSLVRVAVTPSTAATATLVPPTSTPRTTRDSYLRERGPASFADLGGLLVKVHQLRPAAVAADRLSHGRPGRAMDLEAAVLEGHAGPVLLFIEGDLDKRGLRSVGVVAPLGRELPGQQDAVRSVDLEDRPPVA